MTKEATKKKKTILKDSKRDTSVYPAFTENLGKTLSNQVRNIQVQQNASKALKNQIKDKHKIKAENIK